MALPLLHDLPRRLGPMRPEHALQGEGDRVEIDGLREVAVEAGLECAQHVGVAAKVEALDGWFDEHGMIDTSTGQPASPTRLYVAVLNSKQRALVRLEAHVAKLPALDPQAALRAYLNGSDDA